MSGPGKHAGPGPRAGGAISDSVRTVMLDGAGVAAVGNQIGILLAWGLISFVVALRMFRWQ